MGFFERYLTIWVALCIIVGIAVGHIAGESIKVLSDLNISSVNIPVAILVWLMIYPMMVQIDFSSITKVGSNPKGLALTLIINWLIKPFTMYAIASFFLFIVFKNFIYNTYKTIKEKNNESHKQS